ncbi:MAG: hypothetical protein R2705_14860 [Ilumatobacteraceae bacterium]
MSDNARRIAAAVDPLAVADADTGYGNAINVVQTVQTYERAGIKPVASRRSGSHRNGVATWTASRSFRSRRWSPRCKSKLSPPARPRLPPLIARTDARPPHGFDDALDRAKQYAEAGADAVVRRGVDGCRGDRVGGDRALPASRCCSTGPKAARPHR